MRGNRMVRKPVLNIRRQRNRAAADKEDPLKLGALTELALRLGMQPLDELLAGATNEISDVLVVAEQSHAAGARRGVHRALGNFIKIEPVSFVICHMS